MGSRFIKVKKRYQSQKMDKHCYPFDETLAQKAGLPDYINEKFFSDGIRVIDRLGFKHTQGFEPDVGSIFIVTLGGSVTCEDSRWNTINGSLVHAPGWHNYEKFFQDTLKITHPDRFVGPPASPPFWMK